MTVMRRSIDSVVSLRAGSGGASPSSAIGSMRLMEALELFLCPLPASGALSALLFSLSFRRFFRPFFFFLRTNL